jgi:hypothetical protein
MADAREVLSGPARHGAGTGAFRETIVVVIFGRCGNTLVHKGPSNRSIDHTHRKTLWNLTLSWIPLSRFGDARRVFEQSSDRALCSHMIDIPLVLRQCHLAAVHSVVLLPLGLHVSGHADDHWLYLPLHHRDRGRSLRPHAEYNYVRFGRELKSPEPRPKNIRSIEVLPVSAPCLPFRNIFALMGACCTMTKISIMRQQS